MKRKKNVEPCKFALQCKRFDCWYTHPEGRSIDWDPNGAVCRFGQRCNRPECFYKHPKVLTPGEEQEALEEARREDFVIHLDELEMPQRPDVKPSPWDREVFIDPLPGDEGSAELDEFLAEFGKVEDIFAIPSVDQGYVRFADHSGAETCVAARVGRWSESERALAGQLHGTEAVYPDALIGHLLGRNGRCLQALMDDTNVRQLRLITAPRKTKVSASGRVHFVGRATPEQRLDFQLALEVLLASVHERFGRLLVERKSNEIVLQGVPLEWRPDDLRKLCAAHGEVMGVISMGDGAAIVTYRLPSEADVAHRGLDGWRVDGKAEGGGEEGDGEAPRLRCEFGEAQDLEATEGDPEELKSATIFVGGLPGGTSEEEVRELCERVGPVEEVRLRSEKDSETGLSYAFVDFTDPNDVPRALRTLRKVRLRGRNLQFDWGGNALFSPLEREDYRSPAAKLMELNGQADAGRPFEQSMHVKQEEPAVGPNVPAVWRPGGLAQSGLWVVPPRVLQPMRGVAVGGAGSGVGAEPSKRDVWKPSTPLAPRPSSAPKPAPPSGAPPPSAYLAAEDRETERSLATGQGSAKKRRRR